MHTYDEMVDSGIDYLGLMPKKWQLTRASMLFTENKTSNKDLTSISPMKFRFGEIVEKNIEADEKTKEEIKRYTVIKPNDIMLNGLNLNYDFVTQRVALAQKDGCITPAYICLRSRQAAILPKYANYLLKALDGQKVLNGWGTGIRLTLNYSELKRKYLPQPDIEVQQKIAEFLDAETAKIDNLITKQERLLQLLEEKRRATITHAVTRGLNPSVELKETSNTWIPLIPRDWSVGTLRHHAIVETGGTPSRDDPTYWKGGTIPWMSSGEVNLRRVGATKEFITTLASESTNAKLLPKGTVMMALNGQGKTKGMVAVLEISAACNQSLVGIKCTRVLNPYFLYYYLFSRYKDIRGLVGDHRDGLNMEHVRSLSIPLAPIEEQEKIVEYLKLHEKRAGEIEEKIQTQISLLRERRTSLISHAVTGKVKIT